MSGGFQTVSVLNATKFVPTFTDIDAAEMADEVSTAWQLVVGLSSGVALIVLALLVGAGAQRRGAARDETRKADLRAVAEASGAVSFTDLDLSDDSDFDSDFQQGVPEAPAIDSPDEIPEYL